MLQTSSYEMTKFWRYNLHGEIVSLSVMSDSVTSWTVAYQIPLSMECSRQEFWNGLPFPSPGGDLPDSGIKPMSPALQASSLPSEPPGKPNIYGSNS